MSSARAEREPSVEMWTADPSRTTVEFEVQHLWGLHAVRGRFHSFDAVYDVGPEGSAIELTIDAASVDTGCPATGISGRPTSSAPSSIRRCGSPRRASPGSEAAACG